MAFRVYVDDEEVDTTPGRYRKALEERDISCRESAYSPGGFIPVGKQMHLLTSLHNELKPELWRAAAEGFVRDLYRFRFEIEYDSLYGTWLSRLIRRIVRCKRIEIIDMTKQRDMLSIPPDWMLLHNDT